MAGLASLAGGQNGLAMCSSAAQPQTQPPKAAQGRANSELRNVAPAAGGRPQNNSKIFSIKKLLFPKIGEEQFSFKF